MRPLILAVTLMGCAAQQRKPCEFSVWVRVLDQVSADAECHALNLIAHDGSRVKDTTHVRGCAPKGMIITNGSESNMGHEMRHQVEANCQ